MTWALSVLAVPVLYVVTWPPMEFTFGRGMHVDPWNEAYKRATGRLHRNTLGPWWLISLYKPLHRWRDSNSGDNLAARYWEWWRFMMNEN